MTIVPPTAAAATSAKQAATTPTPTLPSSSLSSSSSSSSPSLSSSSSESNQKAPIKMTAHSPQTRKTKNPMLHLVSGGIAGFVESTVCHPLDTIKTRMQLRRQSAAIDSVRTLSTLTTTTSFSPPPPPPSHGLVQWQAVADGAGGAAMVRMTTTPTTHMAAATATVTANATSLLHQSRLHEPGIRLPPPTTTTMATTTTTTTTMPSASAALALAASSSNRAPGTGEAVVTAPLGPLGTASRIIRREGFLSLYKGLTAVYMGIIPKMAIRFVSFEQYREVLHRVFSSSSSSSLSEGSVQTNSTTKTYSPSMNLAAGLASGITEAIVVVTPAEVCKIRLQGQLNSMIDPAQLSRRKYTNVVQTAATIVREEGIAALYKGVVPTMLRQGCNQAVNFTAYQFFKQQWLERQERQFGIPVEEGLQHWQSLVLGGITGGFGPLVNNPLDVVKTRMQKQVIDEGRKPKYTGLLQATMVIAKEEGIAALWKGITPRLLRIMPGQAITFMTYEAVKSKLERFSIFD